MTMDHPGYGATMETLDKELRNGSLSVLHFLKRPPWFMMPLEDVLMAVLHAAVPGYHETKVPCA